jgi:hypothetical protein
MVDPFPLDVTAKGLTRPDEQVLDGVKISAVETDERLPKQRYDHLRSNIRCVGRLATVTAIVAGDLLMTISANGVHIGLCNIT